MPYIKQDRRKSSPETAGELNYHITRMIMKYLGESPGYTEYNSVVGVLECAKIELYRRMVAPYEDKKIVENGDVYK
jgi:broad-specificity NMP kinase